MKVFAIFAIQDRPFFERLRRDVAESGIEVLSALDIVPIGGSIVQSVTNAIAEVDDVLVLITKASELSSWVGSEAAFALSIDRDQRSKRVIPLLAQVGAKPPLVLQDLLYIDLSTPKSYEHNLSALIRTLKRPRPFKSNQSSLEARLAYLKSEMRALELERSVREKTRQIWAKTIVSSMVSAAIATAALGGGILGMDWLRGWPTGVVGFIMGIVVSMFANLSISFFKQRALSLEVRRVTELFQRLTRLEAHHE